MLPVPFRVVEAARELRDTVTLAIEPAGPGDGLAPFLPGQFSMLYAYGVGEAPISVSGGDLLRARPLLHTVRAVGPVSAALCALRPGDQLGVRGPFGSHWPVAESSGMDVVVVAGGIGLAPLRPALHMLLAERARYGQVALCYGARTPLDLLYEAELAKWKGRGDLQVEITVDSASPSWRGPVGVVTALLRRVRFDPQHTVALMCGPEVMMRHVAQDLQHLGVDPDRVYLSMERNMQCAVGLCGHCQLGPAFVCKDGPVFPCARLAPLMRIKEL